MFRKPERKIVYDSTVEATLERALDEHERLYEVMRFFEWLLERSPDSGHAEQMPPPNDDVWLIRTEDTPLTGVPSVRLLYTFDDEKVVFIGAQVS